MPGSFQTGMSTDFEICKKCCLIFCIYSLTFPSCLLALAFPSLHLKLNSPVQSHICGINYVSLIHRKRPLQTH